MIRRPLQALIWALAAALLALATMAALRGYGDPNLILNLVSGLAC